MLNGCRVIDADGHVNDWHLDWENLVPPNRRGDVPKSVRDKNGFPHLEVEGKLLPGGDHGDFDFTNVEEVISRMTRDGKYWLPRPGEEDPTLRLPDMDEMGIDVAVLFGGHCFLVASMVDSPAIATATLQAYNTYLGGYCSTDPARLKGVAMLALQSPKEAADELRRTVNEYGFVAGVIPPHHKNGPYLNDEALNPIWEAAVELGVPICVHTLGTEINPVGKTILLDNMGEAYGGIPSMIALGHLVVGGVLGHHPELKVAFLETGAGWVPYFMDRLQAAYTTFTMRDQRLPRDPEDYIRSGQLYFATEPDEALLSAVADIVGADQIVLGSDYCHPEGMCPYTMKVLAERDDISAELKQKILSDNPARLYGI
ncbi:MAG: BarH protein [Acidimicrobiales bacterium]|jgi:predicted TIM-barrel fold metal-dependent hydrolase|nr:BarH protein [Acidimicrobiales bacterium]